MKILLTLLALAFAVTTGPMTVQAQGDEGTFRVYGTAVNTAQPQLSGYMTFTDNEGNEVVCGLPEGGAAQMVPQHKTPSDCEEPGETSPDSECNAPGDLCTLKGLTGKCKGLIYPCKESRYGCKAIKCILP